MRTILFIGNKAEPTFPVISPFPLPQKFRTFSPPTGSDQQPTNAYTN